MRADKNTFWPFYCILLHEVGPFPATSNIKSPLRRERTGRIRCVVKLPAGESPGLRAQASAVLARPAYASACVPASPRAPRTPAPRSHTQTGPPVSATRPSLVLYSTSPRNGNPVNGNHLDQSLVSSQKNGNSLAWVLVALTVCLPTLYCIRSRPNLELASGDCEYSTSPRNRNRHF